ncbi:MAG: CocE/NonD family hydrolase [Chitinophagales bacterium]|nr:CocE/NonD family hydrolase [Chitinophagales bacterium]
MKHLFKILAVIVMFPNINWAQQSSITIPGTTVIPARKVNGTLDDLTDFAQRNQVPFKMPDGTILYTDIYLPILQDSLTFDFEIPIINQTVKLVVLQKGFQYLIYDSINGQPNPNPYQLPMILERTPYNKNGGDVDIGSAMSLLGYAAGVQDMRGRYTSQGAYLPLYSDSWKKTPYHNYTHVLDVTDITDPRNGNNHEDGYNTVEFIKNQLTRKYDLNRDGIYDNTDLVFNGSIGTFGASALGYNQFQAAAAHKIDPTQPGLKCLFPIVGPLEFYKSTGFHNGCFRHMLVNGWLRGQIKDIDDDMIPYDQGIDDTLHSSVDYNMPNKFYAANKAIDHFVTVQYEGYPAGYYPNSIGRKDMDGSKAMVDMYGEGSATGTYSRYTNMEVPSFQVAGWWDIFVDGTIETHNLLRGNLSEKRDMQKIVIGPWAHQTITSSTTGDKTYPDNIKDITKIDIANFGTDLDLGGIVQSELISWFRYNLNYHGQNSVGEPKILIPKTNTWQKIIPNVVDAKFPANDYKIPFTYLLNFLLAKDGLKQIPITVRLFGLLPIDLKIDIPKLDKPIIEGVSSSSEITGIPYQEFQDVPAVRMYVVGASDDDGSNSVAGNYWLSADTFPIPNVTWKNMYLHNNGSLDFTAPTTDEGFGLYVHDPDDPVYTIGGGNMIVKTPQGDRDNQGQMNLADPRYAPYTMDRAGVLKYETEILTDSLSIVGFPKFKLWAKTNPGNAVGGLTDCDFYVRVVDVYPDGKELFVVEGGVNARAREFAKSIAIGAENDDAPFSNINAGELYEYYFQMYPIAYTFAKDHKIKILISSSNFPRFQSNANVPIEDGGFFRRQPSDGQTYTFKGIEYAPRTSVQRIAFSNVYPTHIELPVFGSTNLITGIKHNNTKANWEVQLFPNPNDGLFSVLINKNGEYLANIYNSIGQKVLTKNMNDQASFDISHLSSGQYYIEIISNNNSNERITKSFQIF